MVFYFGQIPDHQIAFGEPGHVVLDPTPEPAALPLVRHLCSPSAPHLMPSPREIANTAVLIRGIGVHVFFQIHLQGGNPRFLGSTQKKPSRHIGDESRYL
jgi:hypothetical protein